MTSLPHIQTHNTPSETTIQVEREPFFFQLRPSICTVCFTIFRLRLPIFRLRPAIFRLRPAIFELRLPIFDVRLPIFRLRPSIFGLRLPIFRLRPDKTKIPNTIMIHSAVVNPIAIGLLNCFVLHSNSTIQQFNNLTI